MDISARNRILGSIQQGAVYYFEEERLSSPEPHYFVVLNRNPRTEEVIVLVCASSQVEKRRQNIQKLGFSLDTLVFVSPSEYALFTKETVIDCNRTFEKNVQALIDKLEDKKLRVCVELISEEIIKKLVKGVLSSTQVSEKVQKMLQPDNE